jgi:membrane-associated phospholipid phosphatase
MSKKSWIITSIVGVCIFLALAITFFFTDLQISILAATNNLENPNFFLKSLAAVGEFPIYIGPLLFALVYGRTNKTKLWKLIASFVGLMVVYIAGIRLVGGIFEEFYSSELGALQYGLLAIASLLVYVLLFLLFQKFNVDNLVKLRDVSLIMMLVSAASFGGVQVVKHVMGRVRFRALDETYSEFTNFLTIRDFLGGLEGDDFKSFPSGHTASAACLITTLLIPFKFSNKKWITYLTLAVASLYTIVVALSRVFIGAHYASDTLFGCACTVGCFIVVYIIFLKKGWLNARGN